MSEGASVLLKHSDAISTGLSPGNTNSSLTKFVAPSGNNNTVLSSELLPPLTMPYSPSGRAKHEWRGRGRRVVRLSSPAVESLDVSANTKTPSSTSLAKHNEKRQARRSQVKWECSLALLTDSLTDCVVTVELHGGRHITGTLDESDAALKFVVANLCIDVHSHCFSSCSTQHDSS